MHSFLLLLLLLLLHIYIYINQLRSTPKLDFVFCSHVHHITLNSIVFLSSSSASYASIVSSKKGLLSFFFSLLFLPFNKKHGKKGNENALDAYTSRSHFSLMCRCFAKRINRQRRKKRREQNRKNKERPLKS